MTSNSKTALELIRKALKEGISDRLPLEEVNLGSLRALVSQSKETRSVKLSVRSSDTHAWVQIKNMESIVIDPDFSSVIAIIDNHNNRPEVKVKIEDVEFVKEQMVKIYTKLMKAV